MGPVEGHAMAIQVILTEVYMAAVAISCIVHVRIDYIDCPLVSEVCCLEICKSECARCVAGAGVEEEE